MLQRHSNQSQFIYILLFVGCNLCCWAIQKISWTDHVKKEEVWQRVKEETNILLTKK